VDCKKWQRVSCPIFTSTKPWHTFHVNRQASPIHQSRLLVSEGASKGGKKMATRKTDANTEKIVLATDVLNVIQDEVKPLPKHVLERLIQGRTQRTQILDGSALEQHDHLEPYAFTVVKMNFTHEDDVIRCARMLQWSDERMRARTDPVILWAWKESYRDKMLMEFSVAWYSKDYFEARKDAFQDTSHASYYSKFGLSPKDIKTEHVLVKGKA
jgi:hypothetical protein